VSPLFARAIVTLLSRVDDALGNPDSLDLVDVGSGRGELLIAVAAELPPPLAARARLTGVDVVPRPAGLPAGIGWADTPPAGTVGLLLAHEWLDDVPCEVAEVDPAGTVCQVLVDPADGTERLGEPVTGAAAEWLHRWWPLTEPGTRAEIGTTRDVAWAAAVSSLRRGAALAVDYGHTAATRPMFGSLAGFAHGAEVDPVPDGTRNVTAHVALDAVAAAGEVPGGEPSVQCDQRTALHALGVHGTRPDRALASANPAEYLRRLVAAGEGAELTDSSGLGAFGWVLQPVGIPGAGLLSPDGRR
jgi:SAM-dependent MidA family methyltransferase